MHELKIYRGVICHDIDKKNWLANSKWTWGLWWIFTQALENLKNLHFKGLPLTKLFNVWVKKVQRSYFGWQWILMQKLKENWLSLTCRFNIHMTNLTNFDGLFLIKAYNFWAKKVQRSYIWWLWTLMQNLKKTDLCFLKWHEKICQIFVHRLNNSNFILGSKMAEPNENKNSKQPDQPDAMWNFYFILEINE